MPRKYVEPVVSEITFKGSCGVQHTFQHAWNPRISDNKNWMYQRIAREVAEDACPECVRTRGYYVRPENKRKPLPKDMIPATPPKNCPNCAGQREWDIRKNERVAVCLFCGMVVNETLTIGSPPSRI